MSIRIFAGAIVASLSLFAAAAQQIELRPAPTLRFPSPTDSNSPAFWLGQDLVLFNSTGMGPVRSTGRNQSHLEEPQPVVLGSAVHRPYWIEAVWKDENDVVFAWYHHEPAGLCGATRLTAPEIGALVSFDGGRSFNDLGIILQSGDPVDCSSQNGFFAGGNGDFSVVLGRGKQYFYFLFTNYGGPLEGQGIAVARMPFSRRFNPIGAVRKFSDGKWLEPGIGGRLTPIFPAAVEWQRPDTDSFWGPSIHYNTYLGKFVMLLNHSCCNPGWPQEGVYISFNDSLAEPAGWTAPLKIVDGGGWYPQIMGNSQGGTDTVAGRTPRLYMYGVSDWQIVFSKDTPTAAPQ